MGAWTGLSAAGVLERGGWARSVGGSGPYLGIFARAGVRREAVDADVAAAKIHELPAARSCTYVVPACDYALAATVGASLPDGEMNVAKKLGVTEKEVDKLCDAVLKAVTKEALDPDGLKEALGSAVRNLGEAGKKKGLTTTLPLALGRLQSQGEIRRIPANGRPDQQRYRYIRWKENPLKGYKKNAEDCFAELAGRGGLRQFVGLGLGGGKKAVEGLKLEAVDAGSDLMLPAKMRGAFETFKMPKDANVVLVSGLDGLALHRRELASLMTEEDAKSPLWREVGVTAMPAGGSLRDLPCHAIVERGRVIGLWEFDSEAGEIVWASFSKPGKGWTSRHR